MNDVPRIELSLHIPELRLMVSQAVAKYRGQDLQQAVDDALLRVLSEKQLEREIATQISQEFIVLARKLVVSAFAELRWDEKLAKTLAERMRNS